MSSPNRYTATITFDDGKTRAFDFVEQLTSHKHRAGHPSFFTEGLASFRNGDDIILGVNPGAVQTIEIAPIDSVPRAATVMPWGGKR